MTEVLHIVCPRCLAVNRLPFEKVTGEPQCGACKQLIFRGEPEELDGAAFDKHLARNDIPVLVDFWAPWCGPCRTMAPAYQQAARQLEPHVRVAKLNTEAVPDIAARFGIRSIPTLALFHAGREVARQAGAMDTSRIVSWVQSHI